MCNTVRIWVISRALNGLAIVRRESLVVCALRREEVSLSRESGFGAFAGGMVGVWCCRVLRKVVISLVVVLRVF